MSREAEDADIVRAMATEIVNRAGDLGLSDNQLMRTLVGLAGVMLGHASGGDDQILAHNIRNLALSIERIAHAAHADIERGP